MRISVVSPVYKAKSIIPELVIRLSSALTKITDDFEIILVDDRCPDNSWHAILEQSSKQAFVKGIRLSRNFGQHNAITAGISKGIARKAGIRTPLTYRDMLLSNFIGCLTAIYDQEQLGKIHMPLLRKRQDYGLWLRILKRIPEVHGIKQSLALYRNQNDSISSNKLEMLKWNWLLFFRIEKVGFFKSLLYLLRNIQYKIFK